MFESSTANQLKTSTAFFWSLVALYLMHVALIVMTPYFVHIKNMRTSPSEQIKLTLNTCLKEFVVYLRAMKKFG